MANNRLWLMHRPSGKAICLGRRAAYGWENRNKDLGPDLAAFFNATLELSDGREQDDFLLLMEDAANAPGASGDFHYVDGDTPHSLRPVLGPAPAESK